MNEKQERWKNVRTGHEIKCGLISVDLVGSSKIKGAVPAFRQFMTKQNLRRTVDALANARGAQLFWWAGDGGVLGYLIKRPETDYDDTVSLAVVVLGLMHGFNADPKNGNTSTKPLDLRVFCHVGEVIYDEDHGNMHGDCINFTAKMEKSLGLSGSVVVTDALYRELSHERLRQMFEAKDIDVPTVGGAKSERHRVHAWRFSP